MYQLDEKPELEWIAGRGVRKMSPRRKHSRLQVRLGRILEDCASVSGEVGSEWRFHLPQEPLRSSLLPDVAFVSNERLATLDAEQAEEPPFAPDIAVEIRSPGDRETDIAAKIAIYLRNGAHLVLDVDYERARIVAHGARGIRCFGSEEMFAHEAAPWLTFSVATLFAGLAR